MARFELRDDATDAVLSSHWSSNGAMEMWRLRHAERPVRIVRVRSGKAETPVVEGVWHGAGRGSRTRAPTVTRAGDVSPVEGAQRTLREVLDLIVQTSASDWHIIPRSEPLAPDTGFICGPPGEVRHVRHDELHRLAVLQRDPGIALAWDFEPEPGRGTEVAALEGTRATSRTMEVRVGGSVVHRGSYLDVDRGAMYLPTPVSEEPAGTFTMRAWDHNVMSLINKLSGLGGYAAYCARVGLLEVPGHPLGDTASVAR